MGLLTINSCWIFGPSITSRKDSMSTDVMFKFGDGSYRIEVPQIWNGIADVRDVADAHIQAGYGPKGSGRHIIVGGEATLLDFACILRQNFDDSKPFPNGDSRNFFSDSLPPVMAIPGNMGAVTPASGSHSTIRTAKETWECRIPQQEDGKDHFQQLLDGDLFDNSRRGVP